MKIINHLDVVFIWIYSGIIVSIGIIGSFSLGNLWFLFFFIFVIEPIYLVFAFKRPYRRARAVKKELPPNWKEFLLMDSPFYRNLDTEEKKRFEFDLKIFLNDFSIERTQRGELQLDIKLRVAAAIVTMLHGRPSWEPPIRDGVVIYPGHRFNRHYQSGRGYYAGMATYNGPLILTEGGLEESFQRVDDGYNSVFHEMAHYFDFEDGRAEGIPSTRMDPQHLESWRALIHREWQKVRQGNSYLRSYAGENEAEFFAVATESFFETPWEMHRHAPELYNALSDFFNLDTLEILSR